MSIKEPRSNYCDEICTNEERLGHGSKHLIGEKKIANSINKLMLNDDKDKPVITLNWKDEINRYSSAQVSPDQLKSSTLESSDKNPNRTSIRQKKTACYKEK
jgi:hypothetical protein